MIKNNHVVIDCFTDEPSGYGAPPFIGIHSRYLIGSLINKGYNTSYLTIDDLRYNKTKFNIDNDKSIRNVTKNKDFVKELLLNAKRVYFVMGRFVDYSYVSSIPAKLDEVISFAKKIKCKKTLLYVLPYKSLKTEFIKLFPKNLFDNITNISGPELILNTDDFKTIRQIAPKSAKLYNELLNPSIIEIETVRGCNHKPGCAFCVEALNKKDPIYRPVNDIVSEIKSVYNQGARYFRLGRQPNFYNYMNANPEKYEDLFKKIWAVAPNIQTLHIDNTSHQDVVTKDGIKITKLIAKYCTSGNVGSFGVESFDPYVRTTNNLNGTTETIFKAIEIINKYGKKRGSDGLPKYLPGLNLIYGLNGESEDTWKINLKSLKKILDNDFLVRRTFVRGLTKPSGYVSSGSKEYLNSEDEFKHWQDEVNQKFSLPMIKKVVPKGTILKNVRSEIITNEGTIFRQLYTNPIRVLVKKKYKPNTFKDIEIINHINGFTVIGEPIEK